MYHIQNLLINCWKNQYTMTNINERREIPAEKKTPGCWNLLHGKSFFFRRQKEKVLHFVQRLHIFSKRLDPPTF